MSKENNLNKDLSDFFGGFNVSTGGTEETDPSQELTEDVIQTLVNPEEEEVEDPNEDDLEDGTEEEETEDTDDESEEEAEETEEEPVDYSYKALANYLSEQGIIDFEDSEEIEDTPEILEEAVLNTAKNMLQEYKDSLPKDGKLFLEYIEQGGDPRAFLNSYDKPFDVDKVDVESESDQKKIVAEFLKIQGYTDEEIEEEIQDYEDALIIDKKARTALNKLKTHFEAEKERLVEQQEKQALEAQKQAQEYISEIKNTINSSNTFGGLTVNSKDKKEFENYLLRKDREGLTKYERDLQEDPLKTQLDLAYLKFKNFDFSKVANEVRTKETKRIKNLIKTKDTSPKGGGSRPVNSKDPLEGFKTVFK